MLLKQFLCSFLPLRCSSKSFAVVVSIILPNCNTGNNLMEVGISRPVRSAYFGGALHSSLMHRHMCQPSPARHNLPITCDKPASIVSRGGRSDRTPVRLRIEPLFTYDYICNQYSKKWHQWQVDSDTIQGPHSQLDYSIIEDINGDFEDIERERASSSFAARARESKSLLQRFVRSVTPRVVRSKSFECV